MPTFARIWLHEDRAVLSINKFAELFDVAYDTAWKVEAKAAKLLLKKEMDKHGSIRAAHHSFQSSHTQTEHCKHCLGIILILKKTTNLQSSG